MKVLERSVMPDGTKIKLEDWSQDYPNLCGFEISAYPVAKNTGKYRWVEGGRKFRLEISSSSYANYTNDDVRADYEMLKNGKKTLQDLSKHFWNGEKDMWYLGMDVEYKGW